LGWGGGEFAAPISLANSSLSRFFCRHRASLFAEQPLLPSPGCDRCPHQMLTEPNRCSAPDWQGYLVCMVIVGAVGRRHPDSPSEVDLIFCPRKSRVVPSTMVLATDMKFFEGGITKIPPFIFIFAFCPDVLFSRTLQAWTIWFGRIQPIRMYPSHTSQTVRLVAEDALYFLVW